MKKAQRNFRIAVCTFVLFVLWTVAVCLVDVRAIGPQGSRVGLATINQWFHHLTGVHMSLYVLTDWLSLIPLGLAAGFGLLGLIQWIQRKNLWRVDVNILILGGFYLAVMALFVFFELFVVNFRPVLIEGLLEASYPSSTTLLVICVLPTSMMQLQQRMKNGKIRGIIMLVLTVFTVFMLMGRLISGVHWLSDIIGGTLLGISMVMFYDFFCSLK